MRIAALPRFSTSDFVRSIALCFSALLSLLAGLPVSAQSSTVALVQHANKDAGSSTSSTLAFPANNTAGNWIGVVIRAGALNETIAVSDLRGNVYHKALQFNQTVDGFTAAIYYAENIGAGANTVTVADNLGGTLRFAILEYSGVATSGSLDVATSAQAHSTAASSAPAVATTASGDLLLGVVMTGNPENFTAGAGYKIEESVPGLPSSKLIVEDQVQTSAGATTATATLSTADDWGMGLAAFKAGGGTGGTAPTITGLNPTSGGLGTSVIITGTNFLATQAQGSSTVKFNGVTATPSAWSDTSITAPVPSGATTGNVVVTVNNVASNGVSFTVLAPPSVTINQAAGQADPTGSSPINFTVVFSAAVTGFSNSGVTLSGTASATTAVVTGSGTTYNVAVSGMAQNGTVIATIPAGVASANGMSNTASTSTDNTVTYNTTPPSIALMQHANKDAGTTTSSTLAFPSSNTAGNWIGVVIRAGALNETITVSDSLGNSYKKAVQFNQTTDGFSAAIFYAENVSGGANTVTVSDNVSGSLRFTISEYSGIATVNSLDVTATAQGHSTTSATASVNTAANGDLLLGTIMTGNPENFTAGSGYTIEDSVPVLPGAKLITEDQVQASAGATVVSATMGTADDWAAALAAFKAAGGTSGTAPTITNLNPTTGPAGTPVVITGTNFGSPQGTSTVKFNGLTATPTAWSATSISAPVPTGAGTGNVVVTVNGAASNGVLFTVPNSSVTVAISPLRAGITTGQTQAFAANVNGSPSTNVTWEVDTIPGGNSAVGTISAAGAYTPPTTGGVHNVVARSTVNLTATSPVSTVAVTDLAGVFTYHNDNSRDGVNAQEYALTTSNVNTATFGKLFSCNMDAAVYAQPLWVANFNINGGVHNVILAVSMLDTVYLFDADASPCVTYWSKSLLPAGEIPVANTDVGSTDIYPDIGILGTPVIDPLTDAVYLVAKSKTTPGAPVFKQRLHAMNLLDGSERTNSPLDLTSAITYPGNADMGNATCPNTGGATPSVIFCTFRLNQRAGLALDNGIVYVAWASHGDQTPYHGWVIGFNASTLARTGSFNTTPNGGLGGIWMAGGAPAIDSSHNLYMITGNGDYDGVKEFGDSVIKLNPSTLTLNDWFTPEGQAALASNDFDFGSGGAVVLVDVPTAPNPHMVIGGGKGSAFNGELYVLKRDNLGHLVTGDTQIIQKIIVGAGIFSTEAYWNNTIYAAGAGTTLKSYALDTTSGLFNTSTVPQTPTGFSFPGTTPAVSASGTTNGIVWAIQINNYGTSNGGAKTATPAVLHAYDATHIQTELWNSSMSASDTAGNAVKFTVPTIANGKVYVPTRGDDTTTNTPTVRGRIDVYGLKPN